MFGLGDIASVLLFTVLLGVQYVLASQKNVYWGAILPVAFLSWGVYVIVTTNGHVVGQGAIVLLGVAFLCGQWVSGRKSLKAKQQKELRKMQVQDI